MAQHPNAFTRSRKLPLPHLIGALLCQRGSSQQVMLDGFFGSLGSDGDALGTGIGLGYVRGVSDRAFAKARSHLDWNALHGLNARLLAGAQAWVPRWRGRRVVAGDASVLMPALRACHRLRVASADQRLFALYLPGAELCLHARVHGAQVPERQMLFEALEQLEPLDVLVLDRGYPTSWLVAHLQERGIGFCMRCDKANGWSAMQAFLQSHQAEAMVQLRAPSAQDAKDYECSGAPPWVRLVRCVSSTGQVRVMATNLPAQDFPASVFGHLYHQRWRIEEAFKRLKQRLKLECISGLTQQALLVDVAAKVLADNLAALVCMAAQTAQQLQPDERVCNRAYAAQVMQRWLARALLAIQDMQGLIADAIALLGKNLVRRVAGRSQPRPRRHVKPHPNMAYKG
ncbi:IS4 family transposase [Acidovorax sp. LjRoot66]|uniref:IS4 family transposase n=1 Tax=Acidovorax sp. LjRoot66 TaxID=3342334 RepID=UPI003ECD431F